MDQKQKDQPMSQEKAEAPGFWEQFLALPEPLQKKAMTGIFLGMLIALLTIVVMLKMHQWNSAVGLLVALGAAYFGCGIVWDCASGKISGQKMLVMRVPKSAVWKKKYRVVLQPLDESGAKSGSSVKTYLPGAKKDLDLVDTGIILMVYFRQGNAADIIAWEFFDYTV